MVYTQIIMKNIVHGIMLAGLFIAVSPLVRVVYKNINDLFIGFGSSYGQDMETLMLLFSIPLGLFVSLCGIILEAVISKVSPLYKDYQSSRIIIFSWALFFAIFPSVFFFST